MRADAAETPAAAGAAPQPAAPRAPGRTEAGARASRRNSLACSDLWALLGVLALVALAWTLAPVLLLVFAGVLLALVLLGLAEPLAARLRIGAMPALAATVLGVLGLLALAFWLVGAGAAEQLQTLRETLPRAWKALQAWLAGQPGGDLVLSAITAAAPSAKDFMQVAGLATGTLNALAGAVGAAVLVVAIGIYLAAAPGEYRSGLLVLVPPRGRERVAAALRAARRDLEGWLRGQGVSMLAVGALTYMGLAAIGMPLAFSLALITGLLDFVPYFGPVAAGALVVAVAFTEGEGMALKALLVVLAVQQAEAWLVQPLAQRWAVRLPPVLGLVAVLVFGALFGLPGVLLAVPLIVLTRTLVRELYVKGVLGEDADAPAPAPPAADAGAPEAPDAGAVTHPRPPSQAPPLPARTGTRREPAFDPSAAAASLRAALPARSPP